MGSLLGAVLAVETVALVLLFPKFKERMLQRKEARERFLRSIQRPKAVPPRPQQHSRSRLLIAPRSANPPEQNSDKAVAAIKNYMALDTREEASAIYMEAKAGSAVAQFIVGIALLRSGHMEGKTWLGLSAEQNFAPAQHSMGTEAG